jgi:hypothetical protein
VRVYKYKLNNIPKKEEKREQIRCVCVCENRDRENRKGTLILYDTVICADFHVRDKDEVFVCCYRHHHHHHRSNKIKFQE